MKHQKFLSAIFIIILLFVGVYTLLVIQKEGMNLFPIFFDDILNLNWSGQFNLDFTAYLTLSGLWIMWRNKFSSFGIAFGIMAIILGIVVLIPYLLYLLEIEKGDIKRVLVGARD
ncbi:MAG: hypothetical protein MUE53_08245 [Chitinophagales bacterium]|jgi:hypothetical protein|nr:hypothetical protein [Chitinophagales bacterium]